LKRKSQKAKQFFDANSKKSQICEIWRQKSSIWQPCVKTISHVIALGKIVEGTCLD